MRKLAVSVVAMSVVALSFMPAASASRTNIYGFDEVCQAVAGDIYVIIGQSPAEKFGCEDIAVLYSAGQNQTYAGFDEVGLCRGSGKLICENDDAVVITQEDLNKLDLGCMAKDASAAASFDYEYVIGDDCAFVV